MQILISVIAFQIFLLYQIIDLSFSQPKPRPPDKDTLIHKEEI